MAGVSVNIKPEIIRWVLRTIQFEDIAGSAVELLNKWLTGEKTPTFNQVEEISRKVNIPFGYFFLEHPPAEECSIVKYRTVDSVGIAEPSRNLIDIVDQMTNIQEWMSEYVIENGQEELGYVGSVSESADILAVVKDIREKLNIDEDWYADRKNAADAFRFIKKRTENIHILVMMSGVVGSNTHRKLNIDEFRAFTLIDQYAPLIFINSCDSDTGKLFSIIHELAHIWVGENSFYNGQTGSDNTNRKTEKLCNAVAAEILVPAEKFLEMWEKNDDINLDTIGKIAKTFRCGRYVVIRKALDNGKISQDVYEQFAGRLTEEFKEWKRMQKERKGIGGDYYRNLTSKLDRRFVTALARSASEGRISYTEVYRFTNTNRKTFEKLMGEIGGVG